MRRGSRAFWCGEIGLGCLRSWAREGLDVAAAAARMGVGEDVLRRWMRGCADLAAVFADEGTVYGQVEDALRMLATGRTVTLRKPVKLKRVEYGENGRKVAECETVAPVEEEVYVPPSVTAAMHWLESRRPEGAGETAEERLLAAAVRLLGRAKAEAWAEGDEAAG